MMQPHLFQTTLLQWFDGHGRHDLPWQQNKTPYRVWISEIMLQQTQVTTVIPYYQRFMQRFPDIHTLADADEDTVMHYWSGLGYYRRARYLHAAAKKVMHNFHGKFPDNLTALMTLPGIGRSTAGAILSIAFQKKAAILDGNVKRVLTRLHGITDWLDEKNLWPLAEKYTPAQRTDDYTQAIMDLGATLCIRGKPRCEVCPFHKKCMAHIKGIAASLPIQKPRKSLPVREATFLIIKNKDGILLEKRAPTGVWAGLWSLPQLEGHVAAKELKAYCKKHYGFALQHVVFKDIVKHTFSHFHLMISPVIVEIVQIQPKIMEAQPQIWYNLREATVIGIPAPVKVLLDEMRL